MESYISPTIDVFGFMVDMDWRAYQERKMEEVKKIDSLLKKIKIGLENRNRGLKNETTGCGGTTENS